MNTSDIMKKWISWTPYMHSLLRITSAIMFMMSGTMKLFGWPPRIPAGNTAEFFTQVWFGGVLEAFGGAFILFGLFTRPIAFLLSGEMAVAYWQFHAPKGVWPAQNGGVAAVLYCFIFLYFSAAGAGLWSLDSFRAKKLR